MDTELPTTIDLEGRGLTCWKKDIEKLNTDEGCELKLTTEKVHTLDDSSCSDQEEYYDDEDTSCLTDEAKLERMKREFISLTLNSNRDPIKPGTESRLKNIIEDGKDVASDNDVTEYSNMDDGFSNIHRRYKKLGDYETLIANKDREFEEISPGRVFKRTIHSGLGSLITEESLVIYNCAFWNEKSSEPYDSTWLRHNTIISDLTMDSMLPGLKELILNMKNGEWCEAFIRPEAAFGPLGAPPRIPPNATIFCLIEMVKVVSKDKISMLMHNPREAQEMGTTFDDFFEASDEARMRGNHHFDRQQFKVALQRYKSGIRILEALTYKNEKDEKKAQELLLKLYNNSAKAANSANIPRLALSFCKQAVLLNDREPKTYWHRMVAWKKKGHLDKALGTARQAMHLFANQSSTYKLFQREAELTKKTIQTQKTDLNNLYRLMGKAITSSS